MVEFKLHIPTYYGDADDPSGPAKGKQEFDTPIVPVVVREADGVRIVLGSHDYDDMRAPDVQIERRAGGWVIFLHPLGGGDPSGYVIFLDDGRSFLAPEHPACSTPPTELLPFCVEIPEIDQLAS
jgi:hypothetical protein